MRRGKDYIANRGVQEANRRPPCHIIAELKSKRETTKTELDAYVRSVGLAAVNDADVHVLNEEKRNLEDDLVAIDAQIAELNRRLETTHAEESRAELGAA